MNENEFWSIIERIIEKSNNDPEEKAEILRDEIDQLTVQQIFEFGKIFDEKDANAYRWELWGAAYTILGGCGDDCFMDFRGSLICMGKQIYEDALKNPESLADIELNSPEDLFFEGYQYVALTLYEEKTGNDMPLTGFEDEFDEPKGEKWEDNEEVLRNKYPKLFEKYWA